MIGGLYKVQQEMKSFKSVTGTGLHEMTKALNEMTGILSEVIKVNRNIRHTQIVETVRISRYLPFDSSTSVELFFEVSN